MIVLDASALIAFLNPVDALHARAVATLVRCGPQVYGISPVTHAEVLVGPALAGTMEPTRAAIGALGMTEIGLPIDAAPRLAELRATTRLKLPDCCVILAAQESTATLLSFDDRLAAAAHGLAIDVTETSPG